MNKSVANMANQAESSSKLVATAPEFYPRYLKSENSTSEETNCFPELDYKRQDSCLSTDSLGEDGESGSDVERNLRAHRSSSVVSDASEEGGRDSGIEAEKEPDMVVPDQDTIDRIVTQVELYFSDSNVTKDKFLLKHVRRNKEGYVSLKLVSSFKKVKQLTKDWRVVAYAIGKGSAGIEINDLGTKIRRVAPLPEIDETPVTCTILALNLPLEKPTIDTVSQLFAQCGDIALIRVLKVGSSMSTEIKQLSSKYPALNETHCAWIEFDVPESVKEASKLSSEMDDGMRIIPIPADTGKKSSKATGQKSQANSRKNSAQSNNGAAFGPREGIKPSSRKTSLKYNNNRNSYEQQHFFPNPANYSSFGRANPQRRKAVSLHHMERPNLRDLTIIAESGRRRPKSKSCIEVLGSAHPMHQQQAWLQRHLFAAAVASANSAAASAIAAIPHTSAAIPILPPSSVPGSKPRPNRISCGTLTIPEGVTRYPRGPDGTKGFGTRRNADP